MLILVAGLCFAQQSNIIKGCVVSDLGQPIPYAHIIEANRNFGVAADGNGCFELKLPAGELQNIHLKISALGYNDTVKMAAKLVKDTEIVLRKKNITLQTFDVSSVENTKEYVLGAKRRCWYCLGYFSSLHPGMQYGFLVGSNIDKPLKVNKVEIYLKNKGRPTAPLRLRIYAFDTLAQLPGEEILLSQHVESANKGGEWLEFDLEGLNVFIPRPGAIFTVEWIYAGEEYYYPVGNTTNPQNYGAVIAIGKNAHDSNRIFKNHFETGWREIPSPDEHPRAQQFPIPAIRVHCIK